MRRPAPRLPPTFAASAGVLLAGLALACGGRVDAPDLGALRERFPANAWRALDVGAPCEAPGDTSASAGLRVWTSLPSDARAPIHLHAGDGLDVAVHEIGALGEAFVDTRAVAYRRTGGASIWMSNDAGVEEWLWLEPRAASTGVVAAWEVDDAALRVDGDTITVTDDRGRRLHVSAPAAFTRDGRSVKATLGVRGDRIELSVDSAEELLVDPLWTTTAPMQIARARGAAVTLADGRALVVGGGDVNMEALASAEIFDPKTDTWSTTGAMQTARDDLRAAWIPPPVGELLVAGGGLSPLSAAELYNPSTGLWTAAAALSTPRGYHTLTTLADGRVLAAGGMAAVELATSEIYDPSANTWSSAAPLAAPRSHASALLLADGRVLVAGGMSGGASVATAEIYDPIANAWASAGTLPSAVSELAMALVGGSLALAVGDAATTGDLYDPSKNTWTQTSPLIAPRSFHELVTLPDATALVVGGNVMTVEQWNPSSAAFEAFGALSAYHQQPFVTVLEGGSTLVAGGYGFAGTASAVTELMQAGANGAACTVPAECQSGACVEGVCCNQPCGTCAHCAAADGASNNGVCTPATGEACDDGDACTIGDTCKAGTCTPGAPIACPATPCQTPGTCAPSTGVCSAATDEPDGASCGGGDPCISTGVCEAHVCSGASKLDGASCPGGTCVAGACVADPLPPGATGSGATGGGASASAGATGNGGSAAAGNAATGGGAGSGGGVGATPIAVGGGWSCGVCASATGGSWGAVLAIFFGLRSSVLRARRETPLRRSSRPRIPR